MSPLRLLGPDAEAVVLRLLVNEGRRYLPRYAAALACMLTVAGATSLTAWLMKDVVNEVFVSQSAGALWPLALAVLILYVVKGAATYCSAVILSRVGHRIMAEFQARIVDSILRQGSVYFDSHHSTDLINRTSFGALGARQALETVISSVGRDLTTLIGLAAVIVVSDPVLALIGLVVMPAAVIGLRLLIDRGRRVVSRQFDATGEYLKLLQETMQGIRVVKSFTLEDAFRARTRAAIDTVRQANNRLAAIIAASSPLLETLSGVLIAGVILYAGSRVVSGASTPGDFFSVIAAILLAYDPARRLGRVQVDLGNHAAAARYLFEVLDSVPAEAGDDALPSLASGPGRIELDGVRFGYVPGHPVLDGLSFTLEPGQATALVGPSGSGKSTVLNLIERFYEPSSGRILIDGQDVAHRSRRSVRRAIAYVGQDAFLFSGTVRENILMGRPDADEAALVAAAKAAHAHAFILRLPAGYDSPVGEKGAQLSGGQRARIAIARAFLKDAPILLLDEPTAALDSESEHEVQRALEALRRSRTTLVIAHRMTTVSSADRIHVLEHGRIVESGTHAELMRASGRYRKFYRMQVGGEARDEAVAVGGAG